MVELKVFCLIKYSYFYLLSRRQFRNIKREILNGSPILLRKVKIQVITKLKLGEKRIVLQKWVCEFDFYLWDYITYTCIIIMYVSPIMILIGILCSLHYSFSFTYNLSIDSNVDTCWLRSNHLHRHSIANFLKLLTLLTHQRNILKMSTNNFVDIFNTLFW